jgi:hypothetical protein
MPARICAEPQTAWQSVTCFFGISEGVHSYQDLLGLIALGIAALTIGYNLVQGWNAFLLVRRMNPGAKRGSALASLLTVLEIALRHPLSLLLSIFRASWNLFVRMRMRVEHEIFDPRPEWEWPPSTSDDDLSLLGYWRAFGTFLAERWRWHWRMAWIGKRQAIEIGTASEVNEASVAISRYFKTIKTLRFADRDELCFVCPVEVSSGFIAPLHLLTGLLAQYEEKWEGIIREFEVQTGRWDDIPLIEGHAESDRMHPRDFRELQSFIYHCWLLWGPSIPICKPSCGNWAGAYVSIQYGFGDENNSIEIVGDREALTKAVLGMLDQYFPGFRGMAFPASVRGVLQYSTTAQRDNSNIPPLIAASWGGTQDARPILFYSEAQAGDAVAGRRSGSDAVVGQIKPDSDMAKRGAGISCYYSAYLWAMFVVLRQDKNGDWWPLDSNETGNRRSSTEPWQATIPFFEHGNIADAESCAFAKQVLAEKILGALAQFVRSWDVGTYPLRFAYAAAIDDACCGNELQFPRLIGGETVKERIVGRLKDLPPGSTLRRLDDEKIILFDYFDARPHHHPHSACALPGQVSAYYDQLARMAQSDSASRKSAGVAPSVETEDETPESAASKGPGSSKATSVPA